MCILAGQRFAAVVVSVLVIATGSTVPEARAQAIKEPSALPQRNYRPGEYELYSQVIKDVLAKDFSKAIAGLDSWKQKYPESDFATDRQYLYVQAYFGANQPAPAIDAALPLLGGDRTVLPGESGNFIKMLYAVAVAIQRIPDPTPPQLSAAEKAAQQLAIYDLAPPGVTAADWDRARDGLRSAAKGALLYIALLPATRAMRGNDCRTGEATSTAALEKFPSSAQAAWYLGTAEICLAKTDPAKASFALYEFARAAAVPPVAAMVDPKWQQNTVDPYLEKIYTQYHGPDPEGLARLKDLASKSPLPPPGFTIQSRTEIELEKQAAFERDHPDLALWMKIRDALTAPNGQQYFASELQGSAVPALRGVLVQATPECRPTVLSIAPVSSAVPASPSPEVTLKLAKPLAGKPELHSEVRWEGTAIAFTKEPFELTMQALDPDKIEGLTISPCQPVSRKPGSGASKK